MSTSFAPSTSDDHFFMVAPGIEFPVGGAPANPPTSLIKPEPTLDVANDLISGSYERNITPKFFWNAGGSWDRNDDAGILNRYILHAGVGNKWADTERRRFTTSYGISYTDREEENPDPEKDRRFRRRPPRLGLQGAVHRGNRRSTTRSRRTSISPMRPTTRSTPPVR